MLPRHLPVLAFVLLLTLSAVMGAFGNATSIVPLDAIESRRALSYPAVLIGAGDISVCGSHDDQRTAKLIRQLIEQYPSAEIFTAGDNAQIMGELNEYLQCFNGSWGSFKRRIHPSPGNHDWFTNQGEGYFTYFGSAAGPVDATLGIQLPDEPQEGRGYYSYNLGSWHIVSLNSNCNAVDCQEESAQARWLKADLEKNKGTRCTLLYWHHPVWDSGTIKIMPGSKTLWDIASTYGAEVVVNGHDHHYERFAPMDKDGNKDLVSGTRAFIAGTGGAWLFDMAEPLPTTEVRDNTTFGVLVFKLYADRYTWDFVPVEGSTFTDSGSGECH